ncbi:uncharacterized protein DUF4132 [Rhodococcus sp. OK519]|uniref:DUF4132 domain-containing protein n=1 Tax=Rhodococcus sp. OK519 TaxID=2135729 RepID=UPI000D3978F2|nr:uncharacterized protein DUF4132 [Rhodococcus sp. OK519]
MDARTAVWEVPASWWRRAEAFRGRSPRRKVSPAAGASDAVDRLLERTAADFDAVLHHDSTPSALADAAARYIESGRSGDGSVTALGAAAVWAVVTSYSDARLYGALLDDLVARHGVRIAAEAAVLQAGLVIRHHGMDRRGPLRSLGIRSGADLGNFWVVEPHSRLRSLIAALDDAEYEALGDALGRHRGGVLSRKILSSFLLPTQQQWLDEDLATTAGLGRDASWPAVALLASVTTLAQTEAVFEMVGSREHAVWSIGQRMGLVCSMCANIGPGAEAIVAELFDGNLSAQNKKRCAGILAEFGTDAGLELLLDRLDRKYIRPAVLGAMTQDPSRVIEPLASRAASDPAVEDLLRAHLRAHPDLADRVPTGGPGGAVVAIAAVGAEPDRRPDVPGDLVPPVLADPPWNHRTRRRARTVLPVEPLTRPAVTVWEDGERLEWLQSGANRAPWLGGRTWDEIVAEIAAGSPWWRLASLAYAPEALVRPLIRDLDPPNRIGYDKQNLRRILTRFDTDAVDFVVRIVAARPAQNADVLMPVDGSAVVADMLRWRESKSLRTVAQQWFDRHIDTAAVDVVAVAVGPLGAERSRAERTLRELDRRGHRETLLRAAQDCDDRAVDVVTEILDADPLSELPNRIPALPEWVDPRLLPPVTLAEDGRALPEQAVRNICTMLALSRPDDVYAGVEIVRHVVDAESLAELAWGLFERWADVGFPNPQGWVLDALGTVGNDETARRLAPLLLTWPLESAHRRAAAGLEALAGIGTDAALGRLWSISQGLRFPALRKKADAHIRQVADELGLSPVELADRLIPDLGLGADGTTVFDYGARSFVVSVDERLRPAIADADGRSLPRLPRPKADDADGAADEYKRYNVLRKELAGLADELIARFEKAMLSQRRWTMGNLRRYLLGHPLAWQLCSRLVWAAEPVGSGAATLLRFSLFRTSIGVDGVDIVVDADAVVTIPHPAQMGESVDTWSRVFEEFGIAQPFEQLHRGVFTGDVTAALRGMEGTKTSTRELLSLKARGWEREQPQERGAQIALEKQLDEHHAAVLMVFPGFNVANPLEWAEQKIVHAFVSGLEEDAALDPIVASELLRDVSTIDTHPIVGSEPDLVGEP